MEVAGPSEPDVRQQNISRQSATGLYAAVRDLVEGSMLWELWGRLCWNEIRRRYRRTMIGPIWVSLSLGIFALALSVVWSTLFKLNVVEYLPFVLTGLLAWTFIGTCLGEACTVLANGEAMLKSRQFPYSMLIDIVLARNLVIFGHNLIPYVIAAALCGIAVSASMLLVFPGLVLLVANVGWMTLFIAIVCLRFRDVPPIVVLFLQIAMLVTPVMWPASQLTGRKIILADANLLYHLVEIVRAPLLGKVPEMNSYLYCIVAAIIGWAVTLVLFGAKRHRLVYWL